MDILRIEVEVYKGYSAALTCHELDLCLVLVSAWVSTIGAYIMNRILGLGKSFFNAVIASREIGSWEGKSG